MGSAELGPTIQSENSANSSRHCRRLSRRMALVSWEYAPCLQRARPFLHTVRPLIQKDPGGRLRLLALIEHADTVKRILRHLGLPMDMPAPQPAQAPPHRVQPADLRWEDGLWPSMLPADDSPDTGVSGPPCIAR